MKPEQTVLLRGLSPAALKIFLALLWNNAPMGASELTIHTGYDAEAVRAGLKLLEALSLAHNTRRYNGWSLTLQGRQLALPGLAALEARPDRERGKSSLPENAAPESLDSSLEEIKDLSLKTESLDSDSEAGNPPPDVPRILAATKTLFGEPVFETPNAFSAPDLLLAWIAQAYDKREKLDSPNRLVFNRLKNGQLPDREYLENPLEYLPATFLQEAGLAIPEDPTDGASRDGIDPESEPDPAPRPGSAEWGWQAARGQLELELDKSTFEKWVSPVELVVYENGAFVLGAPNEYTRQWLEGRMTSQVCRLLTGIMNKACQVKFVIWQPPE